MREFVEKEGSNSHNEDLNDFAASYNLYFSRIYFFVSRLIGDSEQSKDIAADVFVKLWEKWGSFESAEHIRSWLYLAAKNAALTWLSLSRRRAVIRKEVSRHAEVSD